MGENSEILTKLVGQVLSDYAHWRRNYFPADRPPLSIAEQRDQLEVQSELAQQTSDLLAALRRSFPFHSPRYIAHQQSETSMMSLVGIIAGLLYNSNNVTPESGCVTIEQEMTATSRLLDMLGLPSPPRPPTSPSQDMVEAYVEQLSAPFGWSHLCSGGTTANIEALWVARNVHYGALALGAVARVLKAPQAAPWEGDDCEWIDPEVAESMIAIKSEITSGTASNVISTEVAAPNGLTFTLGDAEPDQLLALAPNEVLRVYRSIQEKAAATPGAATSQQVLVNELFRMAFDHHLPDWISRFPPAIYVSGTAHYSVKKSLDLLGLGRASVVQVPTTSAHRLDPEALWDLLSGSGDGRSPMAVVAIIGTTEEGAIDPLHSVVALRERLAKNHNQSFWIHADGAWGGYFASLLHPDGAHRLMLEAQAHAGANSIEVDTGEAITASWLVDFVGALVEESDPGAEVGAAFDRVKELIAVEDYAAAGTALKELVGVCGGQTAEVTDSLRIEQMSHFLADRVSLVLQSPSARGRANRDVELRPHDTHLFSALDALKDADSVTVDPHKMGYQHYPCGAIAFRTDTVRFFVNESAPYITKLGDSSSTFQPLHRLEVQSDGSVVTMTEAPATYTLEGSRPSFPATALHLSETMLPLNQQGHGQVVRAAWLAAQELFEWIRNWSDLYEELFGESLPYELVPLSLDGNGDQIRPDTNLVIFGVSHPNNSLADYQSLNSRVVDRFSIRTEAGEHRYSYSQAFFLSSTPFRMPQYPFEAIAPIAERVGIIDFEQAYVAQGNEMMVLRASVMNPYIEPIRRHGKGNLLRDFMWELHQAIRDSLGAG